MTEFKKPDILPLYDVSHEKIKNIITKNLGLSVDSEYDVKLYYEISELVSKILDEDWDFEEEGYGKLGKEVHDKIEDLYNINMYDYFSFMHYFMGYSVAIMEAV